MRLLLRLLVNTVAILVVAYLLPAVEVLSPSWAVVAAIVMALLNTFVRPVFRFLALPLTVLTLGLFILVVNGFMLKILDWLMKDKLDIQGFLWAIVAAALIGVITTVINVAIGKKERRGGKRRRRTGLRPSERY